MKFSYSILFLIALFNTVLAQVPNYVPPSGLIGWWPFDGNANDLSGNGNNGVVNGAVLSPDRFNMPNKSYYFSGANCDTRIDISNFNYNGVVNAFSISFWIKRVGNGCISPRLFEFGNGTGWGVNWVNGNPNMDWVTGLNIPDGTWFHLVYVIQPGTIKSYVNGVFNSQYVIANSLTTWFTSQVCFGRMNHPAYDAFNGNLDDVGTWNRALTECEIQQLYLSQLNQAQITAILTQPTCTNPNGGAINVSVAGGVPPFNYNWSNGLTTQDLSGLSAGNYSLSLTDGAGCQQDTLFIMAVPTGLSLTFNANVIGCYGAATGAITSTVSGGTPPYQYSWSNGATSANLTNVVAGNYTLTVNDANGCTGSASSPVQQPVSPMVITAVVTPLNCHGAATGAIDLTATGATPFYTYNWNNGATTQDLQNLTAGQYTLTLTDANGCVYDTTFNVTQPQTALDVQFTPVNNYCQNGNDGFVNLTVTGGTQPYVYQWNGPNNFTSISQDIFNLVSGTYTLNITDDIGCSVDTIVTISDPINPFQINAIVTNVLCFGAATGNIDITVTGGMAPYTYIWSNGASTQDLSNVAAGVYDLVVLDANLCQSNASYAITQPTFGLQASAQVTDLTCSTNETGAIDVFVSGGTAPYTYAWSSGQTTEDITNVGTGTYTLTITDANACQLQLTQFIAGPAQPLITTAQPVNVSCFGFSDGQISLSTIGGQSPYSILWSTGETTSTIDSLVAGLYNVMVTDANGCQNDLSIQLTQPNQITTSFSSSSQFGCIPAVIDFSYPVNDPNLSFFWDFGNGQTATLQNPSITYNAAGCFPVSLTITAANGCVVSNFLDSLICMVQGPNAAFYSTTPTIDYYTGELFLFDDSEGAIAAYLWTFGDASPNSTEINPIHYFPQYDPQNYLVTLTVTDTNGCIDSVAALFSLIEEFLVFVPNTITLNGDLTNDVFLPIFSNVDLLQDYELTIFNRWGNLVFKSTLPSEAWNGRYKGKTEVQQGMYSWKIKYTDNQSVSRTLIGHVNVLK